MANFEFSQMRCLHVAVIVLFIQLLAYSASAASLVQLDNKSGEEAPIVDTQYGPIQGIYTDKGREVNAFLGIPYAAPPIGELRWMPPQELEPWDGVYSANEQPPGCPQVCGPADDQPDPESSCPPTVRKESFTTVLCG